eukprot:3982602-Pyramimonas_sp.AAC.1
MAVSDRDKGCGAVQVHGLRAAGVRSVGRPAAAAAAMGGGSNIYLFILCSNIMIAQVPHFTGPPVPITAR